MDALELLDELEDIIDKGASVPFSGRCILDKDELLDSVTIDNINVTKQPAKGVVKVFMPNSLEGRTFTYDASYLVENGLAYKGGKTSNPKTLEICNQGGSAVIRFANTNVGSFVSNDDTEVQHNGTLLTKIGTTEEETKFQVNFDFIIQANKIKYKTIENTGLFKERAAHSCLF